MAAQSDVEIVKEPQDVQYESYTSLLENCIRKAWVCLAIDRLVPGAK